MVRTSFSSFLICTLLLILASTNPANAQNDVTFIDEEDDNNFDNNFVFSINNMTSSTRFLIYDVNSGEGFNLRRDVYIRAANLVKFMNDRGEDWVLVLPPWRHLYHWKSDGVKQEALPWREFFDVQSMSW